MGLSGVPGVNGSAGEPVRILAVCVNGDSVIVLFQGMRGEKGEKGMLGAAGPPGLNVVCLSL